MRVEIDWITQRRREIGGHDRQEEEGDEEAESDEGDERNPQSPMWQPHLRSKGTSIWGNFLGLGLGFARFDAAQRAEEGRNWSLGFFFV